MIRKLKILLFAFLFVLFGFSFSSAYKIQSVGPNPTPSVNDVNYTVSFLKGGGVLTSYLGYSKSVLALDGGTFFWWTPNGLPYLYYGPYRNYQGFFNYFEVCSPITGLDSLPGDCSGSPLNTGSLELLQNFFSKVVVGDYVYYNYSAGTDSSARWGQSFKLCFSSSEVGKSLCFTEACNYNNADICGGHLSNSQGYSNLTFASIPSNSVGYAPGQNGYLGQFNGSMDGSVQGNINNQVTGDYVYGICNYKEILVLLETEGYNPYICYGGLDDFSLYDSSVNYNPIPGSGLSILQIWGNSTARAWDTFTDWFIFWNGLYKDSSNNYTAMWESYPAVYRTYFQLYNQYKGSTLDSRTILEYCNLKLSDIDLNSTAGGYFAPYCKTVNYEKQVGIRQSRLDGTIYSEGVYTGDYPISVNWGGVGNMSGLEIQSDGLTFIQDYFNSLKSKLSTNYGGGFVGIIPGYILIFLFAIILFKFISK